MVEKWRKAIKVFLCSRMKVVTNQKEILTSIKDFYQNLFINKDNTLWEANFNYMFFYNNVTLNSFVRKSIPGT